MPPEGFSEETVLRNRHAYYAVISRMDEKLGQVLDALEASGERDNTVVVYTSDHGEMLGGHNLWMKSSMFEDSIRVPLVISWPKELGPARSAAANVSLIDLTATLCELAGADTRDMDGRSFLPLLRNPQADWDNNVLVEFYATWTDRPMAAYRRGDLKLIYSRGEPPQLFDLATDPSETTDLGASPQHAEQVENLSRELLDRWPCNELDQRVLASQAARLK
jgi:choline-sulfatase